MRFSFFITAWLGIASNLYAQTSWLAGLAKVDVTPREPVRMSGYGNRDRPSEGIDTPLYVRCAVLKYDGHLPHVIIAVDTIGLPGSMVGELTQVIEREHRLARQQVVFASTHTHTAPDLASQLSNIFAVKLTESEFGAATRYRKQLRDGILTSVERALQSLAPADLSFGEGKAVFAANRRVLDGARWSRFGVQPAGPVDHSVPVLRIRNSDGTLRGVLFNYACHCTTLDGDYYRINADWAGYAAARLEAEHPGAVALCTIGCGADANPEPRGTRELSEKHGRALSNEVKRIIHGEMTVIDQPISAQFAHAGLAFDLPTAEELQLRTSDRRPQWRRHAEHFLNVIERQGRLPATYPVPIQSWRFGDQLTMVFLGGEVVVDYALRLKRELPSKPLWVTAYANDVMGYIASERIRAEGGYEYDDSGVYYNLPGPWSAGSEDLLIRRVHELLHRNGPQPPLNTEDALRSLTVPAEYRVQLVAAEPQISDPVNIAFGHDGSLWVVEMGDYPRGTERGNGGGRVKRLTDPDGDGVFDHADVFLEGLEFPTGVHPWRDGVIVSAAPEIFFARDRDGDGKADQRESLYRGFARANPQHRVNGFSYGLDHALYCASGDNLGDIVAVRRGEVMNASGHDIMIWPDSGRLALISGRTQYIRSRNDWGEWFGNDNSRPMYHYPIEDRYMGRNPAARYSDNKQQLFDPPVAPPVYPLSDTNDRFNDLYAVNRFTSACSAIVVRSGLLGGDLHGAALVCEPVHNLVHRARLVDHGATYRANRIDGEQTSEFLRSDDPWFRPVRVATGPDGMIWVVDMYRAVIEHPEWIPDAWQQQIDMRAGSDRGRVYRIVPAAEAGPPRWPDLTKQSPEELVLVLANNCGTLRDMAQQELLQRGDFPIVASLRHMAASSDSPHAQVHALWILKAMNELDDATLMSALRGEHAGVLRNAILLSESRIERNAELLQQLTQLVDHPNSKVRLQLALSLGESTAPVAGTALQTLVPAAVEDRWITQAIVSSSKHHSTMVLNQALDELKRLGVRNRNADQLVALIRELIATANEAGTAPINMVSRAIANAEDNAPWIFSLVESCCESGGEEATNDPQLRSTIQSVYERARRLAADSSVSPALRCEALRLFGRSLGDTGQERQLLGDLLTLETALEVQLAAVDKLTEFRDRQSARLLLTKWPVLTFSVREAAAFRLMTTGETADVLLEHLETGRIRPGDLSPAARQTLRQIGSQSLQARANRVFGQTTASNQELLEDYLQFHRENSANADIERGRRLFQQHCAACHIADKAGHAPGPSLSNLTNRTVESLTESILAPNRSVEPRFCSHIVVTSDGRVLTGILAEESGETITLALADGSRTTIQRAEIDELHNTGTSLMPEGFQQDLDRAMLCDVVEYLRSDSFAQSPELPSVTR